MANQARLHDNATQYALRARGAARSGSALLVGLVVCGRCGRQMHVAYKDHPRYYCAALSRAYGERNCWNLHAPSIDRAVVSAFFEAIAPAELDLLDEVLAAQRGERERLSQQYADQVTRAEYEARLAERQYRAVDPDNRLVAAELERRWELALRALAEAREAAERFAQTPLEPGLDPEVRAQLAELSTQLPSLWESGRLTPAQQKELLRSLIRRVALTRSRPDTIELKIVWMSGALSHLAVHPPIHRAVDVADYEQLVDRVLALSQEGYQDGEIARQLTADGFRSARSEGVPLRQVFKIRQAHGVASLTEQFRHCEKLDGCWTVWGLSRELGIDRNWLYRRIGRGTLPVRRHPATGHYLIADDPVLLDQLRSQLPRRRTT